MAEKKMAIESGSLEKGKAVSSNIASDEDQPSPQCSIQTNPTKIESDNQSRKPSSRFLLSAMNRAKKLQTTVLAEYPTFIRLIPDPHRHFLDIPRKNNSVHFPTNDVSVDLVDESGNTFITKYSKKSHAFCAGWRDFSKAQDLERGDALVFRLVRDLTFKVYTIRHNVVADKDGDFTQPTKIVQSVAKSRKQSSSHFQSSPIKRAMKLQAKLSAKYPSFIKCIVPSYTKSSCSLVIPFEFGRQHLPAVDVNVNLDDESGKRFVTKYLPERNTLSAGWRSFSIAHNLDVGDCVVFQLVHILAFKVYILRHNVLVEDGGALGPLEPDTCADVMISNDGIDGEKDSNVFEEAQEQHLNRNLSGPPRNLFDDRDFGHSAPEQQSDDDHIIDTREQGTDAMSNISPDEEQPPPESLVFTKPTKTAQSVDGSRKPSSSHSVSSSMKQAEKLQAKLGSEYPSFIKYMIPSNIKSGSWLDIPCEFGRQHLSDKDVRMNLVDESELGFIAKYLHDKIQLSSGWMGFVIAHKLDVGDSVVFQLIDVLTFKVYIIRRNVLAEADDTLGPQEPDTCADVMISNDDKKESNAFAETQKRRRNRHRSGSPCNPLDDPNFVHSGFRGDETSAHRSCKVKQRTCKQAARKQPKQIEDECGTAVRHRTRSRKRRNANPDPFLSANMSYDPALLQGQEMSSIRFDDHLERIWTSFPADKLADFTYMECFWFLLYREESHRTKVLSWIKKKNIFSRSYVFVPLCLWGHWNLLILCHFGEIFDSENQKPCMLLLDSLNDAGPARCGQEIRKFLSDIFAEEGIQRSVKTIPLLVPKVPQQKSKECGYFSLYYMKKFIESTLQTISDGDFTFINQNWFTHEELDGFCTAIEESKAAEASRSQAEMELDEPSTEVDVIIID